MRTLMVLLLMMVAGVAQAQRVVKCTQADGSVAYQQTACSSSDAQEALTVKAPPPPTPIPETRTMVQAFDPATGMPTEAWADVPGHTSGHTQTTRELRQVFDPATGMPRDAWVDVTRPVPGSSGPARSLAQPRTLPKPKTRYNEGDNSTYEKAKCHVFHGSPC